MGYGWVANYCQFFTGACRVATKKSVVISTGQQKSMWRAHLGLNDTQANRFLGGNHFEIIFFNTLNQRCSLHTQ